MYGWYSALRDVFDEARSQKSHVWPKLLLLRHQAVNRRAHPHDHHRLCPIPLLSFIDMSESKGISLRRKKTTRPTISAPRQISSSQQQQQSRDRSADSRNPSLWETPTNASGTTIPGSRPGLSGDKTSDLVKRRYSTRFAGGVPQYGNGGDGGLVPPVPALPTLPPRLAQPRRPSNDSRSPSREGRSPERGRLRVDVRALKDPNLQAEQYIQGILAEASSDDIQTYQTELQNVKAHTSSDLQHNVYQNRTQFIKISKEADKLKTEMRTLRTLMSELTGALGHATGAGGMDDLGGPGNRLSMVADRKRANRSSVANLEAMWSTHLQTLWKRVEGSQKYLPALPGRHIIMESQRWLELNAATWKPRRRVALVLLNDHVLVASEKKRADVTAGQNGQANKKASNRMSVYNPPAAQQHQTMLVAERCWALQDVSLADISNPTSASAARKGEHNSIANAINIRAGTESLTYATTDSAEKAGLLVAFRKAQEDQRKQLAAEHGERERKLDEVALLTGRDPRLLKKAAADQLEAEKAAGGGLGRSNSVLTDVEGRQQSIRWVEAQIDGLDIDIALQRFEDAVSRVEKLRKLSRSIKGNAMAQEIILAKVGERATKLSSNIARNLVLTSSGMERTRANVGWLLRLGCEEMARTRYLEARTEVIRLRTRQLPFTGAVPEYLRALAFTTFTLLVHSFRTFAAGFFPLATTTGAGTTVVGAGGGSSSAVVAWAKAMVDEFNGVVGRQMEGLEKGRVVWRECVEVLRGQVGVLSEVGVDFTGLIGKGLLLEEGAAFGGVENGGGGGLKAGRDEKRVVSKSRRREKEEVGPGDGN
ncbi:exocyst complex component exo84 [Friedmanniomyces endolithicus]|nr:exocyst complex component exo84 [Friedmanniomyces endolithicus]